VNETTTVLLANQQNATWRGVMVSGCNPQTGDEVCPLEGDQVEEVTRERQSVGAVER